MWRADRSAMFPSALRTADRGGAKPPPALPRPGAIPATTPPEERGRRRATAPARLDRAPAAWPISQLECQLKSAAKWGCRPQPLSTPGDRPYPGAKQACRPQAAVRLAYRSPLSPGIMPRVRQARSVLGTIKTKAASADSAATMRAAPMLSRRTPRRGTLCRCCWPGEAPCHNQSPEASSSGTALRAGGSVMLSD